MSVKDWIEAYRGRGWKVLPIPFGSKHPAENAWNTRPSLEPEDVEHMEHDCGLGIQTGPESGIIVIDVDDPAKLAELPDFEPGLVQQTKRGFHFVFRWPAGWERGSHVGRIMPDVDVRGWGTQIVVEPSENKVWVDFAAELTDLPESLRKLVEKPKAVPVVRAEFTSERLGFIAQYMAARSWESKGDGDGSSVLMTRCADAIRTFGIKSVDEWLQVAAIGNAGRGAQAWSEEQLAKRFEDALAKAEQDGWLDELTPVIALVSHAALAEIVKEEWRLPLVHSEGHFWTYTNGAWNKVDESTLQKCILALDGRPSMTPQFKTVPLKIFKNDIAGIMLCLEIKLKDDSFFKQAEPVIVMANGTLLITEHGPRLIDHAASHRARKFMNFEWNEENSATLRKVWEKRVEEWIPGDTALQGLLQEFTGCCLIGKSAKFQKCLVLDGAGANGKSAFLRCVQNLFSADEQSCVSPMKWTDSGYSVASLAGIRLNVASELPTGKIIESDAFKRIIAGDDIQGRHPYGRPFTVHPVAGHIFSTNELPPTSDQSEGFWRRFFVVPFRQTFQVDPTFQEHLDSLTEGAFHWAVEGAAKLLARGSFKEPESAKQAKQEWRHDSDQIAQFLAGFELLAKGEGVLAKQFYMKYTLWAENNGYSQVNQATFGRRIKAHGVPCRHTEKGRMYMVRNPIMN